VSSYSMNEIVLVLDAVSSSTSTSTANAEYEYEKPGKTSIETLKHANSATSKANGEGVSVLHSCRAQHRFSEHEHGEIRCETHF